MGLITKLVAWTIRLVWFFTLGLPLGACYFLVMFCMSPFFTLSSARILTNSRKIMLLQAD